MCVPGGDGTWGPQQLELGAFWADGVRLVDGRAWKPNHECHSRDHTPIFLDEETESQS